MDFFVDKIVLAPMVRANTIAMRILCLNYGADIVFTPEIVDFSIIDCKKIENEKLGTIDFINSHNEVIFRTTSAEKSKLIFQLGTSSAKRALRALKLIENDVSGLDINMGCPKHFSISGGMGAALLDNVEKVKKILTRLVNNSSIPITCKIRLLPGDVENTISFIRNILSTKISAISIHGRTRYERSSASCNIEYLKIICETFNNVIPIIVNGGSNDIRCYQDILNFKETCGASSVMVARAAQQNPSIFKIDGTFSTLTILQDFVQLCIRYDIEFPQFKYMLNVMLPRSKPEAELFKADTYNEICQFLKIELNLPVDIEKDMLLFNSECTSIFLEPNIIRQLKKMKGVYKSKLMNMMRKDGVSIEYTTKQYNKHYQTCVKINNEEFVAKNLFGNKKDSENATSYAYLHVKQLASRLA